MSSLPLHVRRHILVGGPITVARGSTIPRPFDRPAPPQRLSLALAAGQVPRLLEPPCNCSEALAAIRLHQHPGIETGLLDDIPFALRQPPS